MAPEDVRLAVAVVVAIAGDLPIGRHGIDGGAGGDGRSIHQVHPVLTGAGVAPEDVGLAVAVVIAVADDLWRQRISDMRSPLKSLGLMPLAEAMSAVYRSGRGPMFCVSGYPVSAC